MVEGRAGEDFWPAGQSYVAAGTCDLGVMFCAARSQKPALRTDLNLRQSSERKRKPHLFLDVHKICFAFGVNKESGASRSGGGLSYSEPSNAHHILSNTLPRFSF